MPTDARQGRSAYSPGRPIGVPRRILLVLVGSLMGLFGVAAIVALFWILFLHAASSGHSPSAWWAGGAAVLFAAVVFAGFAAMGVARVRRGLRGTDVSAPQLFARAERWYLRSWYSIVLVASLAYALLALAGAPVWRPSLPGLGLLVPSPQFLLLMVLVLPLQVAIHELGHAAAGIAVGFRFQRLRVGWLTLQRDEGGLRLGWSRPEWAGVLGFHQAMPVDEGALGLRLAVHRLAGPISNLAAAAACDVGLKRLPLGTGLAGALVADLLSAGLLVGAFLGVVNLLPFRTRSGLASDGAGLLSAAFVRNTPTSIALRRFLTGWALGRPPRDWGLTVAEYLAAAAEAGPSRSSLQVAAVAVALDTGDDVQAEEILSQTTAEPGSESDPMRRELALQLAMLRAFQGRTAEARSLLERPSPAVIGPDYLALAQAVLCAAEGQLDEARALLGRWEEAARASGRAASVRVGNEWAVDRLRRALAG